MHRHWRSTFRNLGEYQTKVFESIAIGQDGGHHPRTLEALERKGLIEKYEQSIRGVGDTVVDRIPMVIYRYRVPIYIHIEWCRWCAENA